jgi:hypothetical protein
MPKPRKLSSQLRDLIKASPMSCYRISRETGVAESTLSKFMNGQVGMTLGTVDKIAVVLKLRVVSDLES